MKTITKVTIDEIVYSEKAYKGNWDRFLLRSIPDHEIQEHAEFSLGMFEEGDCDCKQKTLDDFKDSEIIEHLKYLGYILLQPNSLIEEDLIKETLNNLGI